MVRKDTDTSLNMTLYLSEKVPKFALEVGIGKVMVYELIWNGGRMIMLN